MQKFNELFKSLNGAIEDFVSRIGIYNTPDFPLWNIPYFILKVVAITCWHIEVIAQLPSICNV